MKVRVFRKINQDGTTKDWAITSVYPGETGGYKITSYYGKTGKIMRHTDKHSESGECVLLSAHDTQIHNYASKKRAEKLRKGYEEVVGSYEVDEKGYIRGLFGFGRLAEEVNPIADSENDAEPEEEKLYWEIVKPIDRYVLHDEMNKILTSVGESDPDIKITINNQGMAINDWYLGYVENKAGFIDLNSQKGSGRVIIDDSKTSSLIILCLTKLDAIFPEHWRFADNQGNPVNLKYEKSSQYFRNADYSKKMAYALGLLIKPLNKLEIESEIQAIYF